MTRSTSTRAYYEAVEEGTITRMEREVLALLAKDEYTGAELDCICPNYHKRLAELERKGLICRTGTTKDKDTGKIVYKWATTYNRAPMLIPVAKKPSRKELEDKIAKLELELFTSYNDGRLIGWNEGYNKGFAKGTAHNPSIISWIMGDK